jgi:SAM-dependent methyltransferase
MVDGADADRWSEAAAGWAAHWGDFAGPAQHALIEHMKIGAGTRVLDVGCGSGEFLELLLGVGAAVSGVDPAPGMLSLAAARVRASAIGIGDVDLRLGSAEDLPWPDDSFEAVTAVNALQFADDPLAGLAEFARVAVPGGRIGIANWAEGSRNQLEAIEAAVAEADGEELRPDDELRREGGLERLLVRAGLDDVLAGVITAPWHAADERALVQGVLFGEDEDVLADLTPVVIAAAEPFRMPDGGYLLLNAFRYAVGRTPS